MIRISERALPNDIAAKLSDLQLQVNNQPGFKQKVAKAKQLWETKGGVAGKQAFEQVRQHLLEMCVYVGVCNYCEHNEAGDIEHIHPKSFFPEQAFEWNNYLLACKQCNTGYKLDRCIVLNDQDEQIEVSRGQQPGSNRLAMINPRQDDPAEYMMLNLLDYKFQPLPFIEKSKTEKVNGTLQILQLNERDTLIAGRKSTAQHLFDVLERLSRMLNATTLQELQQALSLNLSINEALTLDENKAQLKLALRSYIQRYQHPSVWHAIKIVEAKYNQRWKQLFQQIPEAIDW